MPNTVKNQQLMDRVREMAMDLYHEPEEEVIVGTFDKIDLYAPPQKKKKTVKKNANVKNNTSILDFFMKKN